MAIKIASRREVRPRLKQRASAHERRATAVAQDYAHSATTDIIRRQHVVTATVDAADAEVAELTGRLVDARLRKAKAEAELEGLTRVVGNR